MQHEHYHKPEPQKKWWKTNSGIALIFFFAVAGYFLIKEHAVHLEGNWIWLVFLACPLIHMFHHRGHRGHSGNNKDEEG